MRITNAYSPTEEELVQSAAAHRLKLVTFSLKLERLEPTDMLPRYNRCRVIVEKVAEFLPEIIFVTVRRQGSKLGSENFYTEPILIGSLKIGDKSQYDLLSFDAFAIPFNDIEITLCTFPDFQKRKIILTPKNMPRWRKMTIPVLERA